MHLDNDMAILAAEASLRSRRRSVRTTRGCVGEHKSPNPYCILVEHRSVLPRRRSVYDPRPPGLNREQATPARTPRPTCERVSPAPRPHTMVMSAQVDQTWLDISQSHLHPSTYSPAGGLWARPACPRSRTRGSCSLGGGRGTPPGRSRRTLEGQGTVSRSWWGTRGRPQCGATAGAPKVAVAVGHVVVAREGRRVGQQQSISLGRTLRRKRRL